MFRDLPLNAGKSLREDRKIGSTCPCQALFEGRAGRALITYIETRSIHVRAFIVRRSDGRRSFWEDGGDGGGGDGDGGAVVRDAPRSHGEDRRGEGISELPALMNTVPSYCTPCTPY